MYEPSGLENVATKKEPRMIVCKRCGNTKKYHAKDLCDICYTNERTDRTKSKKDYQLM